MLVRRLVVSLGVAAVGVALLAVPSYADAPTDVYVQTPANGGDDANFPTCAELLPCATLPTALNAVADGGTIHVGPGTFDGWVNLGARAIAVTISGDSARARSSPPRPPARAATTARWSRRTPAYTPRWRT